MDPSKHFGEEDKKKLVQYLNLVAKHARFDVSTNELIEYFKLLNWMQSSLIPKVEANYFEIKKYIEPEEAPAGEGE